MIEELIPRDIIPLFEARYKLLDRMLTIEGNKNILELAAGVSCRGLLMAHDPRVTYVELDLPDLRGIKEQILTSLKASVGDHQGNFFLETGNALSLEDVTRAARHFQAGPISILNEGLLRYLSHEEIAQVADCVRTVLERSGGVWMTPDISLKRFLEDDETRKAETNLASMTGRHVVKNVFEDESAAQKFFEALGFTVERHHMREVAHELVSPSNINMTTEQLETRIYQRSFFVMRLQHES